MINCSLLICGRISLAWKDDSSVKSMVLSFEDWGCGDISSAFCSFFSFTVFEYLTCFLKNHVFLFFFHLLFFMSLRTFMWNNCLYTISDYLILSSLQNLQTKIVFSLTSLIHFVKLGLSNHLSSKYVYSSFFSIFKIN